MKIKIHNDVWKVKLVDANAKKMNPDPNSYNFGLTEYKELLISIMDGRSESVTRSTLIHELVHAFLFESGLDKCVSFTDFWIVSVTKVTQIERLKRRKPYLSQKAINNIFSSQLENRERLQYATYIIPNDTRNPKLLADKVDRGLEIIGAISREDRL